MVDTSTLESVSIDMDIIINAIYKIRSGKFNEVHSMLIYKDDRLVLEQ